MVIDGYHAFMALDRPFGEAAARTAFYLGGGYKYAMAGEGCAFMHAPAGFGPRPPVTGWFAEFEDLSLPPGSVGYAKDARRFLGATFDPSGLYRFTAVQRMLEEQGLTTARISAHVAALQAQLLAAIGDTAFGQAELLNPLDGGPHARFLAFRDARRAALVRGVARRRTASPTCAATCCGSASAFTRTRAMSTGCSACSGSCVSDPRLRRRARWSWRCCSSHTCSTSSTGRSSASSPSRSRPTST